MDPDAWADLLFVATVTLIGVVVAVVAVVIAWP